MQTNSANQGQFESMYNIAPAHTNTQPKTAVKPVFTIGDVTVVLLDKEIVKHLRINEDTLFQQVLTDDGILMRMIRK